MDRDLDAYGSRVRWKRLLRAAVVVALLGSPGDTAAQLTRSTVAIQPASRSTTLTQPNRQVATDPTSKLPQPELEPGECSDRFQEAADLCQDQLCDATNLCIAFRTGLLDRLCESEVGCERFEDACLVASTANAQCFAQAFAEFASCNDTAESLASFASDVDSGSLMWMVLSEMAPGSSEKGDDPQ